MENSDEGEEGKKSMSVSDVNQTIQDERQRDMCVPVNKRTKVDSILSKVEDIEKRINDIKKRVASQVQLKTSEREHLLKQIESLSKGVNYEDLSHAQTDKIIDFKQEDRETAVNEVSQKIKRFKSTVDKGNTENIREMLTTIGSVREEIIKRNKQIENLKMRRDNIYEDVGQLDDIERDVYEGKIKMLENEKNKLHEELVDYIIHDVIENKHEYEKTITELEDENNEMTDLIHHFHIVIRNLKDMNIALQHEIKILKENNERLARGESAVETQLLTVHPMRSESSLKSTMEWLQEQVVLDKFLAQGIQDRDDMSGSMSISMTSLNEEARKDKVIEQKKIGELRKRLSVEHHVMELTEYKMRMLRQRVMKEGKRKIDFLGSVDPRHRASVTSTISEDS